MGTIVEKTIESLSGRSLTCLVLFLALFFILGLPRDSNHWPSTASHESNRVSDDLWRVSDFWAFGSRHLALPIISLEISWSYSLLIGGKLARFYQQHLSNSCWCLLLTKRYRWWSFSFTRPVDIAMQFSFMLRTLPKVFDMRNQVDYGLLELQLVYFNQ